MNNAHPYLCAWLIIVLCGFLSSEGRIPHYANHMFYITGGRYRNACIRCFAFKVTRGNAYSVIVLDPGLGPACQ